MIMNYSCRITESSLLRLLMWGISCSMSTKTCARNQGLPTFNFLFELILNFCIFFLLKSQFFIFLMIFHDFLNIEFITLLYKNMYFLNKVGNRCLWMHKHGFQIFRVKIQRKRFPSLLLHWRCGSSL